LVPKKSVMSAATRPENGFPFHCALASHWYCSLAARVPYALQLIVGKHAGSAWPSEGGQSNSGIVSAVAPSHAPVEEALEGGEAVIVFPLWEPFDPALDIVVGDVCDLALEVEQGKVTL
jgi:hypothetical protein